jgi:DNA helicase HerA-like ATPase
MKQIEARKEADKIIQAIDNGQDSDWIRNALRVLRKIGPGLGILTGIV